MAPVAAATEAGSRAYRRAPDRMLSSGGFEHPFATAEAVTAAGPAGALRIRSELGPRSGRTRKIRRANQAP